MGLTIKAVTEQIPRLETERLILRAFVLSDAPRVQELASNRDIAATTATIPHPYPEGEAARWISTHAGRWQEGLGIDFAIIRQEEDMLVGAIGWAHKPVHRRAEVGYWIGFPYWGKGYATEALRAVIAHAFTLGIHRVFAEHFAHNPASGRVLHKAGMKHEGTLRHHMVKWDQPVDCEVYGILSTDPLRMRSRN